MPRGFVMDAVSLESIATHSHALALFVVYLFLRYYQALKVVSPECDENDASRAGFFGYAMAKPKLNASISYSKEQEIDKSSIQPSSSSFISEEEIQYNHEDAISFLERSSSLQFESTFSERRRFLVACKGNVTAAIHRLNYFLQWNEEHVKTRRENSIEIRPTRDRDYDLWVESCLTAMKMSEEVENIVLPRIIRQLCREDDKCRGAFRGDNYGEDSKSKLLDREGHRVFCIRPALMDTKLAKASTYTSAVAIYLDRSCDREKSEKVTVCVDVRAGRGWPNTHVLRLIPFMKHSMKLLLPLLPERLHRALVYPVPHAFFFIWTMISKCMDPLTVERVRVLEGKCKIEAPPPNDKLKDYIGEKELERLEASRVNNFRS